MTERFDFEDDAPDFVVPPLPDVEAPSQAEALSRRDIARVQLEKIINQNSPKLNSVEVERVLATEPVRKPRQRRVVAVSSPKMTQSRAKQLNAAD